MMLKINRGISKKGEIYGKDGLDFASVVIGKDLSGQDFNSQIFAEHLAENVCPKCPMESLEYLNQLERGVNNLPSEHRETYIKKLNQCRDSLKIRRT